MLITFDFISSDKCLLNNRLAFCALLPFPEYANSAVSKNSNIVILALSENIPTSVSSPFDVLMEWTYASLYAASTCKVQLCTLSIRSDMVSQYS